MIWYIPYRRRIAIRIAQKKIPRYTGNIYHAKLLSNSQKQREPVNRRPRLIIKKIEVRVIIRACLASNKTVYAKCLAIWRSFPVQLVHSLSLSLSPSLPLTLSPSLPLSLSPSLPLSLSPYLLSLSSLSLSLFLSSLSSLSLSLSLPRSTALSLSR